MKKFLIKGVAFGTILLIITGILNWSYLRTDPFDTNRFKHVPNGIEVCNLGASYSRYSFNYEDYNDSFVTFNFGMSFQSAEYDYRILDYYKDKIAKGCKVLIVLSDCILIGRDETSDDGFAAKNRRYYTFLPSQKIKEYDAITDLKMRTVPFVFAGNIRNIFGKNDVWGYTVKTSTLKEDAEEYIEDWMQKASKDEAGRVIPYKESIDAIYKIVDLCKSIDAVPILIITPFPKEYNESLRYDFKEANELYDKTVEEISRKTGLKVYNYLDDPRFTEDYSLFMNVSHLNRKGARYFTNIIFEEIVK